MKTKILYIVPNMQAGGLENFIMNIIRNIDLNVFEIHFLYHYSQEYFFDNEIKKLGGIIHKCTFREDNNIFKYIKFLKEFFGNNKFDIVHSNMLSTSFFTLKYAKKNNCPLRINHAHNSTTESSLKGFIKKCMIRIASRDANILLACSEEAGRFAYGKRKFKVIDNCIDLKRFKYSFEKREKIREDLNITKNEILFGTIGRLNVQKNHLFLLEAFSKANLDNKKLLIIGFGELKNEILKKIDEFNLKEKVILLENIKNTEDYYSAMDCFVLPSKFEGFPLTSVEAQANGLPCVFSNTILPNVKLSDEVEFVSIDNLDLLTKYFDDFKLKKRNLFISNELSKYDVSYLGKVMTSIYNNK